MKFSLKKEQIKNISILFAAMILMGTLLSSCKSTQKCPAYGEAKHFRVERGY